MLTSGYLYLATPTSYYLYLLLPTSGYLYLLAPTSGYLYLQGLLYLLVTLYTSFTFPYLLVAMCTSCTSSLVALCTPIHPHTYWWPLYILCPHTPTGDSLHLPHLPAALCYSYTSPHLLVAPYTSKASLTYW